MTTIDMTFPLKDQVVVITGGGSGIGKSICQAFSEKGAICAIVDINFEAAMQVQQQLKTRSSSHECDVGNNSSIERVVNEIMSAYDKIDILVNCAGIAEMDFATDVTESDWNKTISVNLNGTFFMCQYVGREMLKVGKGKIINMASQAASVALPQHIAYTASKAAVLGVTKVLANEWGSRGITVNSISPTIVRTPMGMKVWGETGEAIRSRIPVGRFAEADEVAAATIFLASDGARMINGIDLLIDGGYGCG